jgi:hypothetical protein
MDEIIASYKELLAAHNEHRQSIEAIEESTDELNGYIIRFLRAASLDEALSVADEFEVKRLSVEKMTASTFLSMESTARKSKALIKTIAALPPIESYIAN